MFSNVHEIRLKTFAYVSRFAKTFAYFLQILLKVYGIPSIQDLHCV